MKQIGSDKPEKFVAVGKKVPEEVSDVFRFEPVVLGREKVRLNFWPYGRLPFLMDKSGPQLYEIFSLSSDGDSLLECIKDMKQDEDIASKELGVLNTSVDTYKRILSSKEEEYEKLNRVSGLENRISGLGRAISYVTRLQTGLVEVQTLTQMVKSGKPVKKLREKLDEVSEVLTDTGSELNRVSLLESSCSESNKLLAYRKALREALARPKSTLNAHSIMIILI